VASCPPGPHDSGSISRLPLAGRRPHRVHDSDRRAEVARMVVGAGAEIDGRIVAEGGSRSRHGKALLGHETGCRVGAHWAWHRVGARPARRPAARCGAASWRAAPSSIGALAAESPLQSPPDCVLDREPMSPPGGWPAPTSGSRLILDGDATGRLHDAPNGGRPVGTGRPRHRRRFRPLGRHGVVVGLRLCLRSIPGAETFIHPNNAVAGQQRH
jgi:hypothetical protein